MIETVGLKKTYVSRGKKINALNGVDLRVEKGDFISIMGSSGSGKSTLLSILGCLDNACEGKYYLNGIDVKRLKDRKKSKIKKQHHRFCISVFFSYASFKCSREY